MHFHGTYIALFVVAFSKQVVHYKSHEVHNLNELEYINGEIWANVFMVYLCVIHQDVYGPRLYVRPNGLKLTLLFCVD